MQVRSFGSSIERCGRTSPLEWVAARVTMSNASFELFDDQAPTFDERTGLPVGACQAIAAAVVESGRLAPGELILEIGPGTGQIGRWFAPPFRYAGIDKSAGMLRQFQGRSEGATQFPLIRADANRTWPIVDGAARTI